MEKSTLSAFARRLEALSQRKEALDRALHSTALHALEAADPKAESFQQASRLLEKKRSLEAAQVLVADGKLAMAERTAADVQRFTGQVQAWIADFTSSAASKDVSEIAEAVRTRSFSRARVLMTRTFGEFPVGRGPAQWLRAHRLAAGFLGLAVFALAAILLGNDLVLARESLGWPSVSGVVTQSQVRSFKRTTTERVGRGEFESARRTTTWFRPAVRYRYSVASTEHEGDRLVFGDRFDSLARAEAEQTAGRWPVGQQVQVFYDPARPEVAVLDRGVKPGPLVGTLVLLVMGALLLYALVLRKE